MPHQFQAGPIVHKTESNKRVKDTALTRKSAEMPMVKLLRFPLTMTSIAYRPGEKQPSNKCITGIGRRAFNAELYRHLRDQTQLPYRIPAAAA
jgi:hypothetical protein